MKDYQLDKTGGFVYKNQGIDGMVSIKKMMKLVVLFTVAAAAFAAPKVSIPRNSSLPLPDGRIVGGYDTDIANNPWQISLQYYYQHFCGGSLISPNWVLTAAHCITHAYSTNLNIRAGSTSKSSGGQTAEVSRIILHAAWQTEFLANDIAVLQLASAITVSTARVATLPPTGYVVPEGQTVIVTGWGDLTEDGYNGPDQLQEVVVPAISLSTCSALYTPLYGSDAVVSSMFCAGYVGTGGRDACQGDSGGPAVVNDVVVGVVSWGEGCARAQYPGVYTNVASFRSWILSNTGI